MIKRKPDTIIKFTVDELAVIKKIAEFDCGDVNCSECECAYANTFRAYANTFRACFKGECEAVLKHLDDNGRL